MSARGKIAVLLPNGWLYGTVNRSEFSRAISARGVENRLTFRLSKTGWRAGRSFVTVVGAQVDAWDWYTPVTTQAKRKTPAKAAPAHRQNTNGVLASGKPAALRRAEDIAVIRGDKLTPFALGELAAETLSLDANAVRMLCIAANVNSIDELTQATLPAFLEALAAHRAGVPA